MRELPFRTGNTWLSDDDLIVFDVMFDTVVPSRSLRREHFDLTWNLSYSHVYSDDELSTRIELFCEREILKIDRESDKRWVSLTPQGGELWSQERLPVWERFCTERYTTTSRNRTMMSVVAVSAQIRDEFLKLWPIGPARCRSGTINDYGVVPWHPFSQLHVGIAVYVGELNWTAAECLKHLQRNREHDALVETRRSWWRDVTELQKFTPDS